MWGLLVPTVLTSVADSLNPVAITQQFVLQGMVRKPKHIWYFILATGITNLIGGFLAYFGLAAFIGSFWEALLKKHGQILFAAELILGTALLISVGFMLSGGERKKRVQTKKAAANSDGGDDEAGVARRIKSVSPMALVALGVGATISELTTALPYFAFWAILFNYKLTIPQLMFILIVYNMIYTSPLIMLYYVYIKAQDRFDRLYGRIKSLFSKWANILAPAVVGLIGAILVYHSMSLLL